MKSSLFKPEVNKLFFPLYSKNENIYIWTTRAVIEKD